MQNRKRFERKVAALVGDAGGQVVGRTRLQKLAYLLELTGLGDGFRFEYRHYGPFSEELADAAHRAAVLGLLSEDEREASWGGFYSIYRSQISTGTTVAEARVKLATLAAKADAVQLELAATAAFLAEEFSDPWEETARRKPDKAAGRLEQAKKLYKELAEVETPTRLPNIL